MCMPVQVANGWYMFTILVQISHSSPRNFLLYIYNISCWPAITNTLANQPEHGSPTDSEDTIRSINSQHLGSRQHAKSICLYKINLDHPRMVKFGEYHCAKPRPYAGSELICFDRLKGSRQACLDMGYAELCRYPFCLVCTVKWL